jgi:multiple sugar transport system substrate-binding protein
VRPTRTSAHYRPADANQQREQLVRRLAAGDPHLGLIGIDVTWTAELAEAGWILPWPEELGRRVTEGPIAGPVASATYRDRLWGVTLEPAGPTREALSMMRRVACPPAIDPALASSWEDQNRLAFESGRSAFMVNDTDV